MPGCAFNVWPGTTGSPELEKLKKIFSPLLLLIFILIPFCGYSDALRTGKDIPAEFSPANIKSFIGYLVDNGEYYRAHTELMRLKSYYPDYISPLCYNVTENYLYYKSGRYSDITDSRACAEKGTAGCGCEIDIFRIDGFLKSGDYKGGEMPGSLLRSDCVSSEYAEYFEKRRHYYTILNGFYNNSSFGDYINSEYSDSYNYAETLSGERKSPFLGAFAGIIPGMGYVYAGDAGTGIVSFILISAGAAITWGAHINDVQPLAAVSGTATFFFYGGSIAGGYMETVKYNRGLAEKLVLRLDRDFMLEKDIDDIYLKCGISSDVR